MMEYRDGESQCWVLVFDFYLIVVFGIFKPVIICQ